MTGTYAIFHLNLAYSSIEPWQHRTVVERCYGPLLDLVEEDHLPLGIEFTGWTLERLAEIAPEWLERVSRLFHAGSCELIGSGYTQLIGPLVPAEVNRWNLRLGLAHYRQYLDIEPRIALVNELAYSDGLVALYREAGFQGLVLDRDNALLSRGTLPARVRGVEGGTLPVLWADSVLFQRLQRYAHGDIGEADYLACFRRRATGGDPLPLYCNDAEVFDFRPGRFDTEATLHAEGEWLRLARLFRRLAESERVRWLSPSAALELVPPGPADRLGSAAHPVQVKKQAKYNLSRWAVSGRNDLWLNSLCHRIHRHLPADAATDRQQRLLQLWASDLRTHITDERWQAAHDGAADLLRDLALGEPEPPGGPAARTGSSPAAGVTTVHGELRLSLDAERIYLTIDGPAYRLVLNCRRGLALHSLAFAAHHFAPIVGTLSQGHFDSIELGADYYSMHSIVELPGEHRRITDLEWTEPALFHDGASLMVAGRVETPKGPITKTYLLGSDEVSVEIAFPGWRRPQGSVRVGTITLLHAAFGERLQVKCRNGGLQMETFAIDEPCLHTEPASSLVSCRNGLGATDGRLSIGDGERGIELGWDPGRCAALPLLHHRPSRPDALTRVMFSLAELDETSRPEGELPPFRVTLRPT